MGGDSAWLESPGLSFLHSLERMRTDTILGINMRPHGSRGGAIKKINQIESFKKSTSMKWASGVNR